MATDRDLEGLAGFRDGVMLTVDVHDETHSAGIFGSLAANARRNTWIWTAGGGGFAGISIAPFWGTVIFEEPFGFPSFQSRS